MNVIFRFLRENARFLQWKGIMFPSHTLLKASRYAQPISPRGRSIKEYMDIFQKYHSKK